MRALLLGPALAAALSVVASAGEAASHAPVIDPVFGIAPVFAPHDKPRSVIVLLSDASGFGAAETRLAGDFVGRGGLVIGLSWPAWRREIAARHREACSDLLGHVEGIVLRVERERGIDPFITPIIAGVGMGGSAARALAPEAASHRIAGVVALNSSSFIEGGTPICGGIARRRPDGYVYVGSARGSAQLREVATNEEATRAVEQLEGAGPHGPGDLADLPLFVTPTSKPPQSLVVALSGDGGVGLVDGGLANALAVRGIATVTIDSRRYFWSERDPMIVAHDIRRILGHFRREWPVKTVALVGYSFGADILPLAYKDLPHHVRRHVAVVSLLGLAPAADLRVELNDNDYPNAQPLLPAAASISGPQVQCVYGQDDALAALACPALAAARPQVEVHKTSGGHNFNGNVEALADIIASPLLAAVRSERPAAVAKPAPVAKTAPRIAATPELAAQPVHTRPGPPLKVLTDQDDAEP